MIPYRSVLDALHDYVPGKSIEEIREKHGLTQIIKLASNENPLGASPKAKEAFIAAAQELHLYPRGECPHVRRALAKKYGVAENQIILGNGSDEVLALIANAFLDSTSEALTCTPTFSVYEGVTRLMDAGFRSLPLRDWTFDLDALAQAITAKTRVIFLCNPNNPTGTYIGREAFTRFMSQVPARVLVVVDQAYSEFATASDFPDLIDELNKYPNMLISRTFSKIYGLAGLRVGYGFGSVEVIAKLWKVKPPFDVNLPAQAAATAALGDQEHFAKTLEVTHNGFAQLTQGLAALGLHYLDTQANFIAVKIGSQCPKLVTWLESQGMIVRGLGSFGIPEWMRVTIGKAEENARYLELLAQAKSQGVF